MEIRFSDEVLKATEAMQMYDNGDRKKSLKLLQHFASKGSPNAFGTLTWHYALNGDYEKSIDLFNKYSEKMSTWISNEIKNIQDTQSIDEGTIKKIKNDFESQMSNTKSNVAISFKAINNENQAIMLWREAAENHKHLESRFFLILNENTNHLTIKKMFEDYTFTPSDIADIITILKATEDEAQGWFKNWIKSGLELLKIVEEELIYIQSSVIKYQLNFDSNFYGFLDFNIKYYRAFKTYIDNKSKENFDSLKDLASKGFPHAFSTVIWVLLFEERFEEAITFFNQHGNNMQSWLVNELKEIKDVGKMNDHNISEFTSDYEYQIANAKSNVAVAFKATGQDSLAKEIWKESSEKHSHREAKFYLLLNDEIQNLNLSQLINERGFSIKDIIGLFKDLNSIIEEANGWFNLWARKGLELLNLTREELSICYEISEIINLAKTQEGFFQEYILENFAIATKAATAEAILKGYIKPNEKLINDLREILDELKTSAESLDNEDNLNDDESDFDDMEDEDD